MDGSGAVAAGCCRGRLAMSLWAARVGPVAISVQARAYFRALCRRRRGGYSRAHAGRCGVAAMGPGRRGRKPARARRRDRLAGARHLGAGRIHADRRRQRPSHQFVPLPQTALRHLQGFHADFAAGVVAQYSAGARGFAVQDDGRRDRGGARRSRAACLLAMPAPERRRIWPANFSRISPRSISTRFPTRAARPRSTISSAVRSRCRSTTARNRSDSWRPARCARLRSPRPSGRRSCRTCPACRRPCRATTPKCGGACSGPAGMPPDVVAKLSHDFVAALNTDAVKERLPSSARRRSAASRTCGGRRGWRRRSRPP